MTPLELEAIKARAEAVGDEVGYCDEWGYCYDGSSGWSVGPKHDPQSGTVVVHDRDDERAKATCEFIAHARTDVPRRHPDGSVK